MRPLDLDAVAAFVLVADLKSFTRAGEALGLAQSAVSAKLKRLEARLDRRLVERHPRLVRLSAAGVAFLPAARELLAAHERALADPAGARRRLALGISDHVAGADLPALLKHMSGHDPTLTIEVRIAPSRDILADFDRGELDAAVVRREAERRDGEVVAVDALDWFAAPDFEHRVGEPLRLANLAAPCSVRALAMARLDAAGLGWTEVFVGGGVAAVGAAITAGLAVAALSRRVAPVGAVAVGDTLALPPLPASEVVLYGNVADARAEATLRRLVAGFRATSRD